jgi:hypothetical protein
VLNAVRIWILLSTLLVASGWILSAFHELNRAGYCAVFALAAAAALFWRQKTKRPGKPAPFLPKLRRRFKRPAPAIFLILAVLTLIAGLLYIPSNGDSNAYRIPRMLHWLDREQWHWIPSLDQRVNVIGCNFEWLGMPILTFTRTDQYLFLPNWLSFLLMPGLLFSVFTRLGISRRVAWWWMWLLPSGWCYIMQAGSTINDSIGVVFALAAVDLAYRAREKKSDGGLCLAMLAVALLTGIKQTLLPLALPGLIAILPGFRLLLKHRIILAGTIAACLVVSFVPITLFNIHYTGRWIPKLYAVEKTELHSPFWGVVGNAFCMTAENLKPPIFPFINSWNAMRAHFLQTPLGAHFQQFEDFGKLSLGMGESSTGIGSGICLLLIVSLFWARHYRQRAEGTLKNGAIEKFIIWCPWALMLLFMAKVGAVESSRQFSPYYVFLFPSLLMSDGQQILVRRKWWQGLGLAILLLAVALLITSRDRPLFPAQALTSWLHQKYPNSKFVARVTNSYELVWDFENQRKLLGGILPPNEKVAGYAVVVGTYEPALWFPLGVRSIVRILPGDTLEQLQQQQIHYIVVAGDFPSIMGQTIQQYTANYDGKLVAKWNFFTGTDMPQTSLYLISLPDGR